jgi:hypothetical protein
MFRELNWKQADKDWHAFMEGISKHPDNSQSIQEWANNLLQSYRTPAEKCDAFLKNKLNELAAASTKQEKKAILNSTWPIILAAGTNCNADLMIAIAKQAESFNDYKEDKSNSSKINPFTLDVMKLVGAKYGSLIVEPLGDQKKKRQSVTQDPN